MKNLIFTTGLLLSMMACRGPQAIQENWQPLFNGENLDGWDIKFTNYPMGVNYKNTFRVEDGLLKIRYDEYDSLNNIFGHLITKETYAHYKVRAEYRFVGEQIPGGADWAYRNNGIMIHSQSAESMRQDLDFPVSIEVQLLGGDGSGPRSNMNVCTPGTLVQVDGVYFDEHCYSSTAGTYDGDQWVTVEVEVRGDSIIKHIINGETVLQYEKPVLDDQDTDYELLYSKEFGKRLVKGHIALQAESHPTDFRKVEILLLEDQ